MKKKLTALLLAPMLVLPGCTSEETPSQTAEVTAATVATTTQPAEQVWIDTSQEFATYEEFLNEYTKGRSSNYVYTLPDVADTWETKKVDYHPGSHYTLRFTDAANQVSIMLEIDYTSTFSKISQYLDIIGYSYGGTEIVEQTDRYAIKHYLEFDSYSIIGLTSEENIMYTLVVNSEDETKDPIALLKEYMELLAL